MGTGRKSLAFFETTAKKPANTAKQVEKNVFFHPLWVLDPCCGTFAKAFISYISFFFSVVFRAVSGFSVRRQLVTAGLSSSARSCFFCQQTAINCGKMRAVKLTAVQTSAHLCSLIELRRDPFCGHFSQNKTTKTFCKPAYLSSNLDLQISLSYLDHHESSQPVPPCRYE